MVGESESVKVVIEQWHADSDEIDVESPWADHIEGDLYQLKNFPFYAYGISFDDIFEARVKYDDDDRPYVGRVVEKSGHHTIRAGFDDSLDESEHTKMVVEHLADMGCGYEGFGGKKNFVINVQPHVDYNEVCDFLNDNIVAWEHGDPPGGDWFVAKTDS